MRAKHDNRRLMKLKKCHSIMFQCSWSEWECYDLCWVAASQQWISHKIALSYVWRRRGEDLNRVQKIASLVEINHLRIEVLAWVERAQLLLMKNLPETSQIVLARAELKFKCLGFLLVRDSIPPFKFAQLAHQFYYRTARNLHLESYSSYSSPKSKICGKLHHQQTRKQIF